MTSSRTQLYNALLAFMTTPTANASDLPAKVSEMADAIDSYIEAVVLNITTTTPAVVAPGIPVSTTGGPGATTAPGAATIAPGGLKTN